MSNYKTKKIFDLFKKVVISLSVYFVFVTVFGWTTFYAILISASNVIVSISMIILIITIENVVNKVRRNTVEDLTENQIKIANKVKEMSENTVFNFFINLVSLAFAVAFIYFLILGAGMVVTAYISLFTLCLSSFINFVYMPSLSGRLVSGKMLYKD